jgi:O-acetyl-ADP-ribose deacetylase (regulator of RNase III)
MTHRIVSSFSLRLSHFHYNFKVQRCSYPVKKIKPNVIKHQESINLIAMWRKKYYENPRRLALAAIAKETQEMTPTIAAGLPHLDVSKSEKLDLASLPPLDPAKCPQFRVSNNNQEQDSQCQLLGTTTRVFNQDSFNAALCMPSSILNMDPSPNPGESTTEKIETEILTKLQSLSASPANLNPSAAARVAVLNMASDRHPGGGWLKGASAQEEALCFRSTLAASLHRGYYPLRRREGLYTPDVVVFRRSASGGSEAGGHKLMVPETPMAQLPVVSVLSVAGIRRPDVRPEEGEEVVEEAATTEGAQQKEGADGDQKRGKKGKTKTKTPKGGPFVFADPAARELTKDKMRLCLRMAGAKGHTMLVLGALGCGAFRNPPQEVARCWQEVLGEAEFAGGWFREIWFAVYDRRNEGNFEIFRDAFDGKVFGARGAGSVSEE